LKNDVKEKHGVIMDIDLLNSCSKPFQKGMLYIEKVLSKDISCADADSLFILGKFDEDVQKRVAEIAKTEEFWRDIDAWVFERQYIFYYLKRLGLDKDPHFIDSYQYMKSQQTVNGSLGLNSDEGVEVLRVFSLIEPDSKSVKDAVKYYVEIFNGTSFDEKDSNSEIEFALSLARALSELNFYEYRDQIERICNKIKTKQHSDGFFGDNTEYSSLYLIKNTAAAITCLSRTFSINDEAVKKGIEWLKKQQEPDGSWGARFGTDTTGALFALLSVGEGPKKAIEQVEWQDSLKVQEIKYMKPYFIHTSPIYNSKIHVKEIHDKIREMIHNTEKEICIGSLYIDTLYEDLIDLINKKPHVKVRLITRYSKDLRGPRERIAQAVLGLLTIATKGGLRKNDIIHSRLVIVDDKEVLVSSADWTRDQLYDEFNAGIYTRDKDSVQKVKEFFENLWKTSE